MECVLLVMFNVVVNGRDVGQIVPTRGIRQRDPLSLYLFILVADVFVERIAQGMS